MVRRAAKPPMSEGDLGVRARYQKPEPQRKLRGGKRAHGPQRPLGIPMIRDRVAQMAAKLVLEPNLRMERIMLQPERPPVSRVREIRMHGLKGGPAPLPLDNQR